MDCIFDYKLSDMQEYFVSIGEKNIKLSKYMSGSIKKESIISLI